MKKVVLILSMTIFSIQLNAQVKKAITKPKGPAAPTSGPVLNKIDFFSQAPDDAVQILSDEFKKLKIVLNDIEETPGYDYDVNGKKLNSINSTLKKLLFSNGITAYINTDNSENINEISFVINSGNIKHYKAIKKMLGYAGWPAIAQTETDTTFRQGNVVVNTAAYDNLDENDKVTGKIFSIAMKQISPYAYVPKDPKQFNARNLSVYDNIDDVGYALVEAIKRLGINMLYKSDLSPTATDGEFHNYTCTYTFSNSVSVIINTAATKKLKEIAIVCSDPITFSKIKKAFGVSQWPQTGTDHEMNAVYYSFKNVDCAVYTRDRNISFGINPLPEDIQTRMENTTPPSFDDLVSLYHSGTPEQIRKTLASSYVTQVSYNDKLKKMVPDSLAYNGRFSFKSPNNLWVSCEFNFEASVDNSLEIYISSQDLAYIKDIFSQYQNGSHKEKYAYQINAGDKVVKEPDGIDKIYFMNKDVRDEQMAQNAAEKERLEHENARIKEQEKLDAIEKDRLKAEKTAKTNEAIEKLNEALKKLVKKP